jgi:RHS repeat-associated protein
VDGGVNKSYTPNVINQYSNAEGLPVTNGSEHEIAAYEGVSYTYINDGHLASVTNTTTGSTMAYSYDALGRCVKRLRDGWDAKYNYYDGEKELVECGPAGGVSFRNVYGKGIDEIIMRTDNTRGGIVLYYQQDQEGSVTQLTDRTGAVIEKYQYDAFGAPVIRNGAGAVISASAYGNPLLFTGRRYQPTFGFYEYRARAYHPGLGRFTSEDPKLFDAGDYNLYRYCHNDPLDLTDPMGTEVLGYDNFGDYMHDVGQVAIGELKGAGSVLSLGVYRPSYANVNQQLGGYVGQGLTVIAAAAATKASPRAGPVATEPPGFTVSSKIGNQMGPRGWTTESIGETLAKPKFTAEATNKATGGQATAYFREDGSYIVRDNKTGSIIQVSNRFKPDWKPDRSIKRPDFPQDKPH